MATLSPAMNNTDNILRVQWHMDCLFDNSRKNNINIKSITAY